MLFEDLSLWWFMSENYNVIANVLQNLEFFDEIEVGCHLLPLEDMLSQAGQLFWQQGKNRMNSQAHNRS